MNGGDGRAAGAFDVVLVYQVVHDALTGGDLATRKALVQELVEAVVVNGRDRSSPTTDYPASPTVTLRRFVKCQVWCPWQDFIQTLTSAKPSRGCTGT